MPGGLKPCIESIKSTLSGAALNSFNTISDRLLRRAREFGGGPGAELEAITEYHKDLFNKLNDVKEKVYGTKDEYTKPVDDKSKIPSITSKYEVQKQNLVNEFKAKNNTAPEQRVENLSPKKVENKKEEVTYGKMLDSVYMAKERDSYLSSKQGLAISAVSQTSHAIAQLGGPVTITSGIIIRFPHNSIEGLPNLSSITNVKGDNISNINSQVTDGSADVTKSKFLAEMGVTQDTTKNFLFLVRLGVDPYSAALLLNQPAVKNYLRLVGIQKNVSLINKKIKSKSYDKVYSDAVAPFGGMVKRSVITKNPDKKPTFYSNTDMEDAIRDFSQGKTLSAKQGLLQKQMLDDYMTYDSAAWDLFKFNQGYNWATDRLGDPNMVRRKELLLKRAQGLPISSVDRILEKTYIGGYSEQVLKLNDAIKTLFPIEQGASGGVLDRLAKDIFAIRGLGKDDYQKVMLKGTLSLLDHVVQTKSQIAGSPMDSWIGRLMIGKEVAANWVKAMQHSPDLKLANNLFLKNIMVNLDPREGHPSTMELLQKDYDTYTSNNLTAALRDLKNDATVITVDGVSKKVMDVYNRIIIAGIIQSGTQSTAKSWAHLIPNEDYGPIIKGGTSRIDSGVANYYNNGNIYRALWNDDRLVPQVPKMYTDDPQDPQVAREVKPYFNNSEFLKVLGDKNASIISLAAWKYKDKPAMKTVDIIKDEKGKTIDRIVRLYKRIDLEANTPAVIHVDITYDDGQSGFQKNVIFKEINKWGAQNMQEYHELNNNSVLSENPAVQEYEDDRILAAMQEAKVPGSKDWDVGYNYSLEQAADELEPAIGEDIGDPEAPSEEDIIKNLEDKDIIKRDCN